MLHGNAAVARIRIIDLATKAFREAYEGDSRVDWTSPRNDALVKRIEHYAAMISRILDAKPLFMPDSQDYVPYIKGKVPASDMKFMLDTCKAFLTELYATQTTVRRRKYLAFKNIFEPAVKAQVIRWNNDSEAYYPSGRRRKTVDGVTSPR